MRGNFTIRRFGPILRKTAAWGGALIGDGYTEGVADWIPAAIYFDYLNPVNGLSYTTSGQHYLIAYYEVYVPVLGGYYWYDPLQLGFSDGFSDPFVIEDYYGEYTYVSYWISVPIYAGSTWATLTFQGQTQCPPGTPFTPTGVPCTNEPTPTPTSIPRRHRRQMLLASRFRK